MKRQVQLLFTAFFLLMLAPALPVSAAASDGVQITILHTNDMHSRILPADDRGLSIGFPEIAAAVRAVRTLNPDTLFLDAGDTLHGMPDINISRGENMVKLMNTLGYDAMAPGNHDYNYGSERLQELSKELHFPVLSANVVDRKTGKPLFAASKTFVLDGVRIAVFGLTTPETAYKAAPQGVKDVKFVDAIDAAKKMVRQLRKNNDVVIALAHIGLDKSSVVTSDQLAAAVPGIDIIIDGHSHTELPQGRLAGNTLIAQTGSCDHNLGRVDFVVKDHKIIGKTARLYNAEELKQLAPEPDAAVAQMIQDIKQSNDKLFDVVVANSKVSLSSDRGLVRCEESALGDLSADAMRVETGADIALVNGGSLRSDLRAGNVTKRDMMAIFPFGNTIRKAEVSGAQLLQAMEHSVAAYPALSGAFLQVSGIRFTFDAAAEPGHRVTQLFVAGQPVQAAKLYTVAINDFMHSGGDGYDMLMGTKIVGEYGTMEELFSAYLNQYGVTITATDGRIQHVEEAAEEDRAA